MRHDRIHDPEGDRIVAQETRDREMEKESNPAIYLGPLNRCEVCGCIPKELLEGLWICACGLPVGVG